MANSEPGVSLNIQNEPKSTETTQLNLSKMSWESRWRVQKEQKKKKEIGKRWSLELKDSVCSPAADLSFGDPQEAGVNYSLWVKWLVSCGITFLSLTSSWIYTS